MEGRGGDGAAWWWKIDDVRVALARLRSILRLLHHWWLAGAVDARHTRYLAEPARHQRLLAAASTYSRRGRLDQAYIERSGAIFYI